MTGQIFKVNNNKTKTNNLPPSQENQRIAARKQISTKI
jgi:hypothetical protein